MKPKSRLLSTTSILCYPETLVVADEQPKTKTTRTQRRMAVKRAAA